MPHRVVEVVKPAESPKVSPMKSNPKGRHNRLPGLTGPDSDKTGLQTPEGPAQM